MTPQSLMPKATKLMDSDFPMMFLPQHTTPCSKVNTLQATVHCTRQYSLAVTETLEASEGLYD